MTTSTVQALRDECKRLIEAFGTAAYWRGAELETLGEYEMTHAALLEAIDHLVSSHTAADGGDDEPVAAQPSDERDAQRYRWLREADVIDWDTFPFPDGFQFDVDVQDSHALMVDAAIDAAMAGVSAQEGKAP